MDEQQLILAAIQQIAQAALQGDQTAQQVLQYIGQVALNLQGGQQVQAARQGAKLQYLGQLRGTCPEGTELQYYKAGGRICKKCVKKAQGGSDSEDAITAFRKERCGGKMKKKAVGGTVDIKKNAVGGTVDTVKGNPKKLCKKH